MRRNRRFMRRRGMFCRAPWRAVENFFHNVDNAAGRDGGSVKKLSPPRQTCRGGRKSDITIYYSLSRHGLNAAPKAAPGGTFKRFNAAGVAICPL